MAEFMSLKILISIPRPNFVVSKNFVYGKLLFVLMNFQNNGRVCNQIREFSCI